MGKRSTRRHRGLTRAALTIALACGAMLGTTAAAATAAIPPIKHVFVLTLENESEATSFGANSPAPYLAKTLPAYGAFVPNYYGIGHFSLDNYIAMVSGQAPNTSTSGDCPTYSDFSGSTGLDANGQETGQGCVYPADVPTLMGQLHAKGLSWRGYMDDMGANPARDNPGAPTTTTCGHPIVGTPDGTENATVTDKYATRHDPFVYFHSVIDDQASCNAGVVPLNQLATDLQSVATTPTYSFITPNLCNDGHDTMTVNCNPGGLAQANTFLQNWVPKIISSPAFRQDGLLIVTFDEASPSDSTACCGEVAGPGEAQPGLSGPGGGPVGAVMLSKYIAGGTKSSLAYNHYSMLGSVEDMFGLPRLAGAVGPAAFSSDIFTLPNGPVVKPPTPTPKPVAPKLSGLNLSPGSFSHRHPGSTITYTDSEAASTNLTIEQLLPGYALARHSCRALGSRRHRPAHSRACTVTKSLQSLTNHDRAGSNRVKFNGRLRGHALAAGSYEVAATPKLGSLSGRTQTARFRVR